MTSRIAVIVLAVCAGCGGGNQTFATGSATISGTVGGQTLTPKDAISAVVQNVGIIAISNADTHCAKINAKQTPKNLQFILIGIGTQNPSTSSSTPPAGPGVFPVYGAVDGISVTGPVAAVLFRSTGATCLVTAAYDAITAGNVTLTRVDASGYAGTFDVTFTDNSHVTGSFTSANCPPLASNQGGTCT